MDFKGQLFAMLVQARELANSLIVMGKAGCADLQLEGNKGGHIILARVYNVTKEEIEKIVNIFVNNVESQIFTTSWLLFLHTVLPKRMGNSYMPRKAMAHINK